MKKDNAHNSLLRTKLYRPPAPADYVHRPLILEYIDRGHDLPLTLVSAPAGYGKSILISSWLDTIDRSGAWLSLDEKDNDLRRFLAHFLSAIQTVFPTAGLETLSMLKAPDLPPVPVLADSLINDLDRIEDRFILVLDDFHLILEKAVNGFVRELLRHPPLCMHLVIISRKDPFLPISSLRAQNMLAEVRTQDLRFTASDTVVFLKFYTPRLCPVNTSIQGVRLTEYSICWIQTILNKNEVQRFQSSRKYRVDLKPSTMNGES